MMEKYKKGIGLLLGAAILAGCLGGCSFLDLETGTAAGSEETGTDAGQLATGVKAVDNVFSLNYDSQSSFNPYTSESAKNLMITPLLYQFLYDVDENFAVTPGALDNAETEDYVTWTFHIAAGAAFSDGSEVTAQDAAYSLQQAKGCALYSTRLSRIAGVTAQEDGTLTVRLTRANSQLPALLNVPLIKNGSAGEWIPLGSGAFKMSEDYLSLIPNTYSSAAKKLPLDCIYLKEYTQAAEILSAFEDSTLDLVLNDPLGSDHLGYSSANAVRYYNTTNMHYIGFNASSAFFSEPARRAALTYAIDRSTIVTSIMNGCAAEAALPMSPLCSLYNNAYAETFAFSLEKCERLLENAEVTDTDEDGLREFMVTGIPVEIDLDFVVCSDNSAKVTAARAIAANLESLGISVTLRELGWEEYQAALTNRKFDMYYGEVKLTADFDLTSLLAADGRLNYGKFSDPNYASRIHDYLNSDEENRQKNSDLMMSYIMENMPIVCICFEKQQVVTHRGVVTGMAPTQYNIFNKISDWTVNLK